MCRTIDSSADYFGYDFLMLHTSFLHGVSGDFFLPLSMSCFRALYIGITKTKVLTMNAVVMALVNVFLELCDDIRKVWIP